MKRQSSFISYRHSRKRLPLDAFFGFFSKLASRFRASAVGRVVCGYGALTNAFSDRISYFASKKRRITRVLKLTRYRVSRAISESKVLRSISALWDKLMLTSLRSYGFFGMTFSLFTVLVHFVKVYAIQSIKPIQSDMIFAIVVAVLSLPLIFSGMPLRRALFSNPLCAHLLRKRLGMRSVSVPDSFTPSPQYTIPFILGTALGIIGFFIRPIYIMGAIASLVFTYLIFMSPEATYLMVMFSLPLLGYFNHPTAMLCTFTLLVTASFGAKLIMGKRILKFEPLDLSVLLFMILLFFGGVFGAGGTPSLASAITYTLLFLGYFVIVNLFSGEAGIHRASKMIVGGAIWVAFIALIEQISGKAEMGWIDTKLFAFIEGRVTSSFENPNMLAMFLVMALPFSLALLFDSKNVFHAIKYLSASALIISALVFTWSRGAWLSAIVSVIIFLIFYTPKLIPIVAVIVATVPMIAHFLPQNIVARFVSITNFADSSISYRFDLWQGCLKMIGDHLLGGIGLGESAFGAVYPQYALSGIESAFHSHSLALQILIELGLFGLIVFVIVLLLFFQNAVSYRKIASDGGLRVYNIAAASAIVAMLVGGLTDYVWYNYRIFAMFWMIIALGGAIGRANRKAHTLPKYVHDDDSQNKISASMEIYFE